MELLDRLVARLVTLGLALAVLAVGLATAFGFLVAGSYMLLERELPGWAAALIVGGALAILTPLVALVLVSLGRNGGGAGAGGAPAGSGAGGGLPGGTAAGAGAAAAAAALQATLQRSPWSLLAGAFAIGIVLGMSREARQAATGLLAALLQPPPRS